MPLIPSLRITAATASTACGLGLAPLRKSLTDNRGGLRLNDFSRTALPTWIGRVDGVEEAEMPAELKSWDCRNNRLAWLALQQDGMPEQIERLISQYGAERVAIIIGTSTSSIGETEDAYMDLDAQGHFSPWSQRPLIHTPHSLGNFLQAATGLNGPCVTVATACSSSAKVFAQAARMINAGIADAALVGGVDTLCGSVLFGFNSLGLIAADPCRPFDQSRCGLSLGEAGGYAVLERQGSGPQLIGYGESSDAHHMSSPHPDGLGAQLCMQRALDSAGLAASEVDYLNLHGTATPKNDEIEGAVLARLFPLSTRASSTKGFTGHTLGAAGIVESLIAMSALDTGLMPSTLNCVDPDPVCAEQLLTQPLQADVRYVMNNSFGFGGNNCSLLFARADISR